MLLSAMVAVAWLVLGLAHGGGSVSAALGPKVLLVAEGEDDDPWVRDAVHDLVAGGFDVTSDPEVAIRAVEAPGTEAFVATRAAFASVPRETWSRVYGNGGVVGGLDVSLKELQPLATGTEAGSARLAYTPGRPIFSLLRGYEGCVSAMSDWLDNWPVADLVDGFVSGRC